MAKDYDVVEGSISGAPVLLLPDGYVYLSTGHKKVRDVDVFFKSSSTMRNNRLYTKKLTDEEEALAMKWILLGETNNA